MDQKRYEAPFKLLEHMAGHGLRLLASAQAVLVLTALAPPAAANPVCEAWCPIGTVHEYDGHLDFGCVQKPRPTSGPNPPPFCPWFQDFPLVGNADYVQADDVQSAFKIGIVPLLVCAVNGFGSFVRCEVNGGYFIPFDTVFFRVYLLEDVGHVAVGVDYKLWLICDQHHIFSQIACAPP